jgi:stage III sporulation protein AC
MERSREMSFNLIITVAGIGILVGVLASVLDQSGRKEMAQGVTIIGVIVVLYIVVQSIAELFTLVKSVFNLY